MNIAPMKLIYTGVIAILSIFYCGGQEMSFFDMISNQDVFSIQIKNAELINSKALEYSPIYYGDGIIFVSSRSKGISLKDKNINEGFFDLFYAPFNNNGMPHQPELFSSNISSPLHVGTATLSQSQDLIYFTRNSRPMDDKKRKNKDADNVQQIFEARRTNSEWSNIKLLSFNSDSFNIVTPALSPDNQRLYFASDMKGGYGGMDLYYVERIGDEWSAPINLGPQINTSRNEVFPFISASGELYFSSNGRQGLGGLDIFVSSPISTRWSEPKNLGAPINSSNDDFGICIAPNGYEGFLSTNRPGGKGKDDIYRFRIELKDDLPYVQTQVVFIDKDSRKRLENVALRIYEMLPNGSLSVNCPYYSYLDEDGNLAYSQKARAKVDGPAFISDINGTAIPQLYKQKQYLMVAERPGYLQSFISVEGRTKEVRIELEKEPQEDCIEVNAYVLDKKENYAIDRATIILVDRITKERFTQDTRKDGSFTVCLFKNREYEVSIQKPGYINKKEILQLTGLGDTDWIDKKYFMHAAEGFDVSNIEEGAVIILNNIYYDYNSAELRRDATKELDDLVVIMKRFPSMEIELISHTDSRGDWLYNQKLSLQRAQSAKRYLVGRGIESSRVQALGYGESQIRNHCLDGVECSEEEHGFNRRTEVRITSVKDNLKVEYDSNGSN